MKIKEMSSILETTSPGLIELSHVDVDLPEIQAEDAAVIPKYKATLGAQLAGGACVCEDTSLCLHSLGGMPGPFIKFFQKSLGNKGLYDVLDAYPVKTATAVCTLAFVPAVHADPIVFEGVVEGTLVNPEDPKWAEYSSGFGWDSIFVPDAYDRPFSAMSIDEKCAISHRGAAVRAWATWMELNEKEVRAGRRAGAKRQLVLYPNVPPLHRSQPPLLVAQLRKPNPDKRIGHRGFSFMKDGKEKWTGPSSFTVDD